MTQVCLCWNLRSLITHQSLANKMYCTCPHAPFRLIFKMAVFTANFTTLFSVCLFLQSQGYQKQYKFSSVKRFKLKHLPFTLIIYYWEFGFCRHVYQKRWHQSLFLWPWLLEFVDIIRTVILAASVENSRSTITMTLDLPQESTSFEMLIGLNHNLPNARKSSKKLRNPQNSR